MDIINYKDLRQGKIREIYKEIVDKTLNNWCKIIVQGEEFFINQIITRKIGKWESYKVFSLVDKEWFGCCREVLEEDIEKIIGHGVRYWDFVDWLENNLPETISNGWHRERIRNYDINKENEHVFDGADGLWEDKRKSIEEQSEKCINFVLECVEKYKNNKKTWNN